MQTLRHVSKSQFWQVTVTNMSQLKMFHCIHAFLAYKNNERTKRYKVLTFLYHKKHFEVTFVHLEQGRLFECALITTDNLSMLLNGHYFHVYIGFTSVKLKYHASYTKTCMNKFFK